MAEEACIAGKVSYIFFRGKLKTTQKGKEIKKKKDKKDENKQTSSDSIFKG